MDPMTIFSLIERVMGGIGGGLQPENPLGGPQASMGVPLGNSLPDVGAAMSATQTVAQALRGNRTKINDAYAKGNDPAGEGVLKNDPQGDPGGSTGGDPTFEPAVPGENPYDQDFPYGPGTDPTEGMFPDDASDASNYGMGIFGGGGGGGNGGGGAPLSWFEKLGLGSQIGGQVSSMFQSPRPPSLPGGGSGFTKIDPVSVQFMLRNRRR